jgi:hypothetical protein
VDDWTGPRRAHFWNRILKISDAAKRVSTLNRNGRNAKVTQVPSRWYIAVQIHEYCGHDWSRSQTPASESIGDCETRPSGSTSAQRPRLKSTSGRSSLWPRPNGAATIVAVGIFQFRSPF